MSYIQENIQNKNAFISPKFDLDDVTIIPSAVTDIDSRQEVNPYITEGFLPLITAPMFDVISSENMEIYKKNKIISCLPRKQNPSMTDLISSEHYCFFSLSLNQFIQFFIKDKTFYEYFFNSIKANLPEKKLFILIDQANGGMKKLFDAVAEAKNKWKDSLFLMVGNIANPESYRELSLRGANMIRISVGSGNVCTSSANTSIHFPLGSLITECSAIEKELEENKQNAAHIIADGGFNNFSDIIKAIALGSSFIMVGSILNKSIESSGAIFLFKKIKITNKSIIDFLFKIGFPLYKEYRGMSTKSAQKQMGLTRLRTSEGIRKMNKVEYKLSGWVENFTDYLKSAMSYCNAKSLENFIGKAEYVFITSAALKRFKK